MSRRSEEEILLPTGKLTFDRDKKYLEQDTALESMDLKRFEELCALYGAKAAHLMLLQEQLPGIESKLGKQAIWMSIPPFQVIPCSVYRDWKAGKSIDEQLRPFYSFISNLLTEVSDRGDFSTFIVRSSARYSEDGVQHVGAGVYKSKEVDEYKPTFEQFKAAVLEVYCSTETDLAKRYRSSEGITDEEEMGIIVQEFVSSNYPAGFANSHTPGRPELIAVETDDSRDFCFREQLSKNPDLSSYGIAMYYRSVFLFSPDNKLMEATSIVAVAKVVMLLEQIFGQNIQIEFVVTSPASIAVVQVRRLPAVLERYTEIEFPSENSVLDAKAVGTCDVILPVIPENVEQKGVLVMNSNGYMSGHREIIYNLPEGSVVILMFENSANGHIQTMCAKRRITCLFSPQLEAENAFELLVRWKKRAVVHLRIVSDGITGRVYEVPAEELEQPN